MVKKEEKTFEESLNELESIVKELESGEVDLDKAIEKYSEAMKLAKSCSEKLNNATEKVNQILKEDGSLDIKRINQLPIDEYMDVVGDLTEEQYEEYLSKLPINESNEPIRVIKVDRPMGVNADDVINNIS